MASCAVKFQVVSFFVSSIVDSQEVLAYRKKLKATALDVDKARQEFKAAQASTDQGSIERTNPPATAQGEPTRPPTIPTKAAQEPTLEELLRTTMGSYRLVLKSDRTQIRKPVSSAKRTGPKP